MRTLPAGLGSKQCRCLHARVRCASMYVASVQACSAHRAAAPAACRSRAAGLPRCMAGAGCCAPASWPGPPRACSPQQTPAARSPSSARACARALRRASSSPRCTRCCLRWGALAHACTHACVPGCTVGCLRTHVDCPCAAHAQTLDQPQPAHAVDPPARARTGGLAHNIRSVGPLPPRSCLDPPPAQSRPPRGT